MTAGFLSLGALGNLWDAEYPGFAYPQRKVATPLLGDGDGAGFVVVQQTAKPLRQTSLVFTAESTADKDTVRGYEENDSEIAFIDYDTSVRLVRILEFRSDPGPVGGLWRVSLVLLEVSDPVTTLSPALLNQVAVPHAPTIS